ncbi:MAG: helix-turn-helix transcriptional regulator [Bacteroidota bacterium]
MEITLIKLALERLHEEVETLKQVIKTQQDQISDLKSQTPQHVFETPKVVETEYINMKEVQRILGICYNTLQKIIQKGLLRPIRINQRRIRYSKTEVMQYLAIGG